MKSIAKAKIARGLLRAGGLAVLGFSSLSACMGGLVSLEDRPCPCAPDYVCCPASNVCVPLSQQGGCFASEASADDGQVARDATRAPVDAPDFPASRADASSDGVAPEDAFRADALPGDGAQSEGAIDAGVVPDGALDGGGRCSPPHTGTWQPVAASPLSPRWSPIMLWAGDEQGNGSMFVWGGRGAVADGGPTAILGDGALYDPRADRWSPVSPVGAPPAAGGAAAVWTGKKVLVWGEDGPVQTPVRSYDPGANTWSAGATPFMDFQGAQFVTWTGSKMLALSFGHGASYDPAKDLWTVMNSTGAPCANQGTAVWTGSVYIVWGGESCNSSTTLVNSGAAYDPTMDTWMALPVDGAPSPRQGHGAVWTGSEMIVWGGIDSSDSLLSDGGAYDPVAGTWRTFGQSAGLAQVVGFTAVGAPGQMLLWGGVSYGSGALASQGAQYEPCGDSWWQMPAAGQPPLRPYPSSVWTGLEMIVWGGVEPASQPAGTGGRYVP